VKATHRDNLADLVALADQLTVFESRNNHAAVPFDWRFNQSGGRVVRPIG
jgi:hypothetical protein